MLVVNQVRRSNTAATWGMAAVMVVFSSSVPFWVNPPDLPELLVTMFFSLLFVEGYRRFQLRPKITWDHSGLDVVGDWKTRRVEWSDVRDIHISGSYVVIELTQGKVEWLFNHSYFVSLISKRYAGRADRHERALRRALECARGGAEGAGVPGVKARDHSWWLYLLVVPAPGLLEMFRFLAA
ncbi:hypothetical protein [Goodfellowiella coeruleoviolacea]|uniref:hypothetical protein n=1 Tax=Goodfellowiella coeruleoviolacea TaxID=334858 RepID=UPI0020A5A217|nr:hypothetical protein [Goodfellowiella coeruleoviolacea]